MRLFLDPAAKAELSQAALFYEDCRKGLGEEFLVAVEAAFDQIRKYPTLWRILKGRFRRYAGPAIPLWRDLCRRRADNLCGCGDAREAQTRLLGIPKQAFMSRGTPCFFLDPFAILPRYEYS